jgi:hypothetical protein
MLVREAYVARVYCRAASLLHPLIKAANLPRILLRADEAIQYENGLMSVRWHDREVPMRSAISADGEILLQNSSIRIAGNLIALRSLRVYPQ